MAEVDLHCIDDLSPYGTLVSGRDAVGQALARRLQTPVGGLLSDAEYGYDLTQLIHRPLGGRDLLEAQAAVEAQALEDVRVAEASAVLSQEDGRVAVTVTLTLVDGAVTDVEVVVP